MGYPEHLLSAGEHIEKQFRPHWSRLIREGLLAIFGLILMVFLAIAELPGWLVAGVAGAVVVLTIGGVVRWLTTHHVVTNERVIYRAGFIAKQGREIPLEVINDVAFSQSVFERVFQTGDLLIESAGTHGQTRYSDIPEPEEVQSLIYAVREKRMRGLRRDPSSEPSARPSTDVAMGESVASQLEKLARLNDTGRLTDQEFESQKNKLLGGS
jgi:uncharacterized membrane protein YdbT with pleckstrin-like domain